MIELLPASVGIGLVVGVFLSEVFGLVAGGMIVPGYLALHISKPLDILLTLAAGFFAFAVVRGLSTVLIIFGRRRTVFMILVGYIAGMLVTRLAGAPLELGGLEFSVVGFIIPGLIAIWMDRQGVFETCASVLIASIIVRLVLIVAYAGDLHL